MDAFCEVKEATSSSVSILQDLSNTLRVRMADMRALAAPWFRWSPRTHLTASETGKLLKLVCAVDDQSEQVESRTSLGADKRVLQLGTAKLSRQDVADVLRTQQDSLALAQKKHFGARSDVQHDIHKLSYWIFERFAEEDKSQRNAEYKFPELQCEPEDSQEVGGNDVCLLFPPSHLETVSPQLQSCPK